MLLSLSSSCLLYVGGDYSGLRALKLIPVVPKAFADELCGAPSKTVLLQVISKFSKPAIPTTAASSASSRAPAIHPVQRSMFRLGSFRHLLGDHDVGDLQLATLA